MRQTAAIISVGLLSAVALATPAVTLKLESSKNGLTVSAGTAIDWTISVAVSTGDNVGLALICCDLVQSPANPALFDIPPGNVASIDSVMDDFSRPLGICNPGESAATGYIGVQRGTAGQRNLIQIGGAQNTFGAAGPSGVGQDYNVNAGVGQGTSPQVVLSGSFLAPATNGSYSFSLANPIANVLVQRYDPPAYSPVTPAAVTLSPASFTFSVGGLKGDLNCDGLVNNQDIDHFIQALFSTANYIADHDGDPYPVCDIFNGDFTGDGLVNSQDIDGFIDALF